MRICIYCKNPITNAFRDTYCSDSCWSAHLAEKRTQEKDLCPYCGQDGGLHAKCRLEWQEKDPAGLAAHDASVKFQQKVFLYGCGGLLLFLFIAIPTFAFLAEIVKNPSMILGAIVVLSAGYFGYRRSRRKGSEAYEALSYAAGTGFLGFLGVMLIVILFSMATGRV
jgi:hypothetical protein